jgi:Coenzyme PQQ synthesis protein D (PqqD)
MPVKLRDDLTVTDTEYGIVLLDETRGEYWNLNPTGALILRSVLEGGTPEDAVRALAEEFEVGSEAAHAHVGELLGHLRSAGLVEGAGS